MLVLMRHTTASQRAISTINPRGFLLSRDILLNFQTLFFD